MHTYSPLFDWIPVPSGVALIGSSLPGEGPRQSLFVSGFLIMKFTVTNRQFQRFVEEGAYRRPEFWDAEAHAALMAAGITEPAYWREANFNRPDQPVTGVSFHEAQAFARWAGCRLPTEVEWQKAAGGPNGFAFPWGDDEPDCNHAHFAPGFVPASSRTREVHDLPMGDSTYRCRQMAGNVHEWCVDFFHYDTPTRRTNSALIEPRPSTRRVLKGGAWTTGSGRLRVAARWSAPANLRDNVVGIRLACDEIANGVQS